MKKLLLVVLVFFSLSAAFSQGKYCLSHTDFINNNWIHDDSLKVMPINDDGYYVSASSCKKLKKVLKKKSRYIIYNDTLYVNCRKLSCKGNALGIHYSLGFRFHNNDVCIISHKVSVGVAMKMVALPSLVGQLSPIAYVFAQDAINKKILQNKVCYLINSDSKKVKIINHKYMPKIIAEHKPELLDEYNKIEKKKYKERADLVIDYLLRMKLISKY